MRIRHFIGIAVQGHEDKALYMYCIGTAVREHEGKALYSVYVLYWDCCSGT